MCCKCEVCALCRTPKIDSMLWVGLGVYCGSLIRERVCLKLFDGHEILLKFFVFTRRFFLHRLIYIGKKTWFRFCKHGIS